MKKIIDWKAIESESLEDYSVQFGENEIFPGLNTQAKKLIDEGYVPFGEIKYDVHTYRGANNFVSSVGKYIKEFVKYEE